MVGPSPFAIALSLLVTSSSPVHQQEGQKYNLLGYWLQQNSLSRDIASSSSTSKTTVTNADPLVAVNSECSVDDSGLRGLKWKRSGFQADLQQLSKWNNEIACRVPAGCAIVADRILDDERPIDALVRTVYCHLLRRIRKERDQRWNGTTTDYEPYFATLPPAEDPCLKSIGSRWERSQLELLLGHNPTVDKIARWRDQRRQVIARLLRREVEDGIQYDIDPALPKSTIRNENKVEEERRIVAEWAYDLVTSRSFEGNFGQKGMLRSAAGSWFVSSGIATFPCFYMIDHDTVPIITMVASMLPLLVSSLLLAYLQISFKTRGGEVAMLPWIDLANHKSNTHMTLEYNIFRNSIVWKKREKSQSIEDGVTASKSTSPDDAEWITFDYGGETGITNDHLLGVYGFVEVDNPNDTIDLELNSNDQTVITVGRYGQIIGGSSAGNRERQYNNGDIVMLSQHDQILYTAEQTRRKLLEREDLLSADEAKSSNCDPLLADVANAWRREKIRLLDELLDKLQKKPS